MDAEAIRDLFDPVARISLKRMFGGHGVYLDGVMIAIEADGVIWMKVDQQTLPAFTARGLKPFTYAKNGKPYEMSYRELPDTAFDDRDELGQWVRLAREAAIRAAAKPRAARKTRSGDR
jgi:DNA transformation protein